MLKIDIKIIGECIICDIVEQDERGFCFRASNGVQIKSQRHPELRIFGSDSTIHPELRVFGSNSIILFTRGSDKKSDRESFSYHVPDITRRTKMYNDIIEAIEEYNMLKTQDKKLYDDKMQNKNTLVELRKIRSTIDRLINDMESSNRI